MIRLPYETEWEYASKNKYLNFSFGNEFDKNKCVSKELNLKMAAPVGMNDIGSNLPCDMTGNIWEWTLSIMKEEENLIDYKKNSVKLLIA